MLPLFQDVLPVYKTSPFLREELPENYAGTLALGAKNLVSSANLGLCRPCARAVFIC